MFPPLQLSGILAFMRLLGTPLFTPDIGIAVFTISALLILFELNHPGSILPGAVGLAGVLLAGNALRQWQLRPAAFLPLALVAALSLWQLRHRSGPSWTLLSAALLAKGFSCLIAGPAPARVHPAMGALCGLLLGSSASHLARIAFRARQNKGLN